MTKPADKIIIKNETGHSIDFDQHNLDAWNKGGETTIIARCNHKWISVNEYNPPTNKPVLAVIKHKESIGTSEVQVCRLDSDYYQWVTENTYEDERAQLEIEDDLDATVTHWMPLPEPPEDNNA